MDAKPECLVWLDHTVLGAWVPHKPGSPQHVFAGDGESHFTCQYQACFSLMGLESWISHIYMNCLVEVD